MGLDAWMYKTDIRAKLSDISVDKVFAIQELSYWRNHRELNDYMCKKYIEKGGHADNFNMSKVILNEDDLGEVLKFIEPIYYDVILWAIDIVRCGGLVYYSCWW